MTPRGEPTSPRPRMPGEHLCLVYESEAEARAVVGPFVEEGVRLGRKVILVAEGPSSTAFRAIEGHLERDWEGSLERDQVEFRGAEACFGDSGRFDRYQAITFVREALLLAQEAGYSGLHLIQDVSELARGATGLRDLTAYEAGLNLLPGEKPLAVLCLYDRSRTSPEFLLRALELHPTQLREGHRREPNPFYQPEVEFRTAHADTLVAERLEILRRSADPRDQRPGFDSESLVARISRGLDMEGSSREGIGRIGAQEIGPALGADASHFFLVDVTDTYLLSGGGSTGEDDPIRLVRGEDVAGRAWLARRPTWAPQAKMQGSEGTDAEDGGSDPRRSAVAIPLLAGRTVRGVIEFSIPGPSEPDEALLERLEPSARILGEALGRIRAEERLGDSRGGLAGLLGSSTDGIVLTDSDGRVHSWNLQAARLLDDGSGEVPVGKPFTDFIPQELRERFRRMLEVTVASESGGPPASVEFPIYGSGPDRAKVTLNATSWEISGKPCFVVTLREELPDREIRTQTRLIESVVSRATREAMLVTSGSFQWGGPSIMYANQAFCRMTGYAESEILGQSFRALAGPKTAQDDLRDLWDRLARGDQAAAEFVAYRKDGSEFLMRLEVSPVRDDHGHLTHFVAVQSDVSAISDPEDRYPRADRDALTGLANRTLFDKVLRRALDRVRRNPELKFAVLFLDLDGFKEVNDSLGHVLGDQLLISVARRLEEAVRPGDVLVRFGGDEFVILLEHVGGLADILAVADRIQDRMSRPFRVEGREVVISASVGIALSDTGYTSVEEVVRDADSAMYRAKEQGTGQYRIFDRALREEAISEGRIRSDLQSSLDRGDFRLHYQPLMDLGSGRISGVEALLRWEHPERGLVAATEFIGHAEAMKLILPLGRWVIRESCRQMKIWQDRLPGGVPIALGLNLSARELLDPRAHEWFEESLAETGVDPALLRVEIAESFFSRPQVEVEAALRPLREMGIRIGIDDFGSGTVSVGQLHRFPVDFLKMDRQFIADLPHKDGGNGRAVRAILAMAESLGLDVVAPGVETTLQEELLRQLACPKAQGYLFSAPVDAEKAGRLLELGRLGPKN